MKISDVRQSGHAPSLFSAFLHFDISFMVWVILGALMPFLMTDPVLTGTNLQVTPTAAVGQNGQAYTLLIKGPRTRAQNPDLAADQRKTEFTLVLKPGVPADATRNAVKPVEVFVVDNARPETLAAVNSQSKLVRIALAPGATGNPNENVVTLQSRAALQNTGKTFQPIANGYPASVKLTLIAIPLLAAGFWRILLGGLVDRFGSRRVGIVSLLMTMVPLLLGWQAGTTYASLVCIGLFLGVAGASFAVALPLASRWYPPHLQGLAMGIAGAGNSGTVLATVFAPLIAKSLGWHAVFGLLAIPVGVVLVVFATLAQDPPAPAAPKGSALSGYAAVIGQGDTWWFCLFYFVTFGGFVGLSSFFNTFFVDQYDISKAGVGLWTWPFIIAGSFLRPVGGALADRWGGIRMLTVLYGVVVSTAVLIGTFITNFWVVCVLLLLLMGALGMGNGLVFQLVPQRFRREIGSMTGLVGAAGGVGGYYLNVALGHLKDGTGTYASGFWAFAGIALAALIALRTVAPAWTRTWLGAGGVAAAAGSGISQPVVFSPGKGGAEIGGEVHAGVAVGSGSGTR